MKKLIKASLAVMLTALMCVPFVGCNNRNSNYIEPKDTQQTESKVEFSNDSNDTTEQTIEDTTVRYCHAAISGCVLTDDRWDGSFSYKEKCEFCDYVSSSEHSGIYSTLSGSTYTSSFSCPNCGQMNKVAISTEVER